MADWSADEMQLQLASAEDPGPLGPCHACPQPEGASGEVAEMDGDPDGGPDPGSQDETQAQAPAPGATHLGEAVLGLPFPRKLWMMVEDDSLESVRWGDCGDTVVIEKSLFKTEVLQRSGPDRIFESDSLKSFTRQLHLHGFSKIRSPKDKGMVIYRSSRFLRDQPELLDSIEGKGSQRRAARQGPRTPAPKRQRQEAATRRSLRLLQLHANREAREEAQEAPAAQAAEGAQSALSGVFWPLSSEAGSPEEGCCPSSPSGELRSGDDSFGPWASAEEEGEDQLPGSPPPSPDYASVLALYNTCYSILLAALSVMAPNEEESNGEEEPDGGEEQDGASVSNCALCEQFKDNPHP
ncbi:PREDICTED: heat shock transcription factor, X-linked-like [Condylura cristata]|uniref:heat shock transcription factor, X-linked-like n=1 Tax=Condylura cristata TaxID=143302 RepID=UPI000334377D|nr:PREDICTED: heat shock transcription factor, X-linked-like [Condylura cristata]